MSSPNDSQTTAISKKAAIIEKQAAKPAPRKSKQHRSSTRKASTKTKTDLVLGHLRRAHGVSLAQLMASTGWQAHSVRAVICGLRKQGICIVRFKAKNGATAYRAERASS